MPATPPGITGPSPKLAAEGRQVKTQYALWRLGVVLALIVLAGVDYAARGEDPTWGAFVDSPEFKGLIAVLVLCFLLFWVRRQGIRQFTDALPAQESGPAPAAVQEDASPPVDADLGAPSGTIICCSGGGIKSASFCLGALQRLDATGRFNTAQTVVAVSGGGYAASAYLAMYQHLDAVALTPVAQTPFAPGSRELAELRRRTNYIASAGRARFDLVTSLLFGVAANVVLAAAGVVALAWGMAQHVTLVQMVDTTVRTGSSLWELNWAGWSSWWLQVTGPLLLLGTAVLIFCGRRIRHGLVVREEDRRAEAVARAAAAQAGTAQEAELVGETQQDKEPARAVVLWNRVLKGARAAWSRAVSPVDLSDAVRTPFLNETPNRLLQVAVTLAAVTLGLPWAAVLLHNVMIDGQVADLPQWVGTVTGVTTIASLIALIRSLAKGIGTPMGSDGTKGRLLEVFRRHVAPALAVFLFVLILFVATAAVTALYITRASRNELGYGPLVLAVFIPMLLWAIGLTNLTTIHPYYRERLSWAYLEHSGAEDPRLAELDPDGMEARKDLTTRGSVGRRRGPRKGLPASLPGYVKRADAPEADQPPPRRPNLVLVATANIEEGDVLPTGRGGTPFILGADALGLSERTLPGGACWVSTGEYRNDPGGQVHLAAAMAISGAAFAPRAGRESKLIGPYRLLLAFANLRLGVWMPNPYYPSSRSGPRVLKAYEWINEKLDRPTSLAVWAEAFGGMPVHSPFLYVTDGGHYDNLGLVESLRRRPARLIVLDGTGDDEDRFPVVGDAVATVRMDHDIEVDFDPSPLLRGGMKYPEATHVRATARYPGPERSQCEITYIKCALPKGLSWDLEAYRLRNPDFPATTQRFEMFDEFDFEAYRKLGESLVDRAIEAGDL